jgi:hypothetical protein
MFYKQIIFDVGIMEWVLMKKREIKVVDHVKQVNEYVLSGGIIIEKNYIQKEKCLFS